MMNNIPFCRECKYFGGVEKKHDVELGICNHPKHPGKYEHIATEKDFWCLYGEFENEATLKHRYYAKVIVPRKKLNLINNFLSFGKQKEEDTIESRVRFADGREVSVYCGEIDEGDSAAWATLYESDGYPIESTDIRDKYVGKWEIPFNNRIYAVEIEEEMQ